MHVLKPTKLGYRIKIVCPSPTNATFQLLSQDWPISFEYKHNNTHDCSCFCLTRWKSQECTVIHVHVNMHISHNKKRVLGMGIAKNFVLRYITIFFLNIVIISRYFRTLHFFLFFSYLQYSLSVLLQRCQIWFI